MAGISPSEYSGPYTANGSQTAFPFDFTVNSGDEIEVQGDGIALSPALYAVALDSDYNGGTVTFLTAPANAVVITIYPDPDFLQASEFENEGAYKLTTVNTINRRSAIRDLWLRARTLAFSPAGISNPTNRAGKFLAWGAGGDPVFASGTGADSALRTDLATSTGGSLVGWLRAATGAVARSIADVFEDQPSVMDFIPILERVSIRLRSSSNDHTAYLQAAANLGREMVVPEGLYNWTSLNITTANTRFRGRGAATLRQSTSATQHGFVVTSDDFGLFNLRLEGNSTNATNSQFAIYTDGVTAARRVRLAGVIFSSSAAGQGFINGIKLDTGSDSARIEGCYFERLWGNASGRGYALLCGGVTDIHFAGNTGIATSGRGRHMCYLSAGTSYSRCESNYASGFNYEAYPQYATDAQPVCRGNIVANNVAVSCGDPSNNGSSISAFQNIQDTLICNNVIISSNGCGIKLEGTASTKFKNNHARGNIIVNAGFIGIDVLAMQGGSLVGNDVRESSQSGLGTYPNIRLKSDATTASSNILVSGNRAGGAQARSSFQLDSTAPAPSNLKVIGNKFDTCNLSDVELNSVTCAIDGYLRASATWDIGSLADGASELKTGISVPGAVVGDRVIVGHTSLVAAGWMLSGVVTASDTVGAVVLNKTGGTLNPASGTLYIDVLKRAP